MSENTKTALIVAAVIALIVLCIVVSVKRHDAQQDCIERGGVIHEYNCTMVGGPKSGYSQVCDWQCVK